MKKGKKPRKERDKESTTDKIMLYLATHNKATRWDLKNELGKSYGNIHDTIDALLKEKLIEITQSKPSERNPKISVDYYDLTMFGLLYILASPKAIQQFDLIVESQKDKLLLFKKWEYLKERKVDKIEKELVRVFPKLMQEFARVTEFMGQASMINEKRAETIINEILLGAYMLDSPATHLEKNPELFTAHLQLWQAFKGDPELASMLKEQINLFKEHYNRKLNQISDLEKQLT